MIAGIKSCVHCCGLLNEQPVLYESDFQGSTLVEGRDFKAKQDYS